MAKKTRRRRAFLSSYIYDALRQGIESGAHAAGAALPSEAQLCELHKASRMTVRGVLKRLADEGFLESRPGRGWWVVSVSPDKALRNTKPILVGGTAQGEALLYYETVQAELAKQHIETRLVLPSSQSGKVEENDFSNLGGAVLFSGVPLAEEIVGATQAAGVPLVCMMLAKQVSYDTVVVDHAAGATAVLDTLWDEGCRQIAYLSTDYLEASGDPSFPIRCQAYDAWAAAHDMEPQHFLSCYNYAHDMEGGERLRKWLKALKVKRKRPDAFFATTNGLMEFALVQLYHMGLSAKDEIRVSGASLLIHKSPLSNHGLDKILGTTGPAVEIGRVAASRLVQRLRGDHTPPTQTVLPPVVEYTEGVLNGNGAG